MLRKFRNKSEDKVQRQIRAAIQRHGAELHEKVRVADIVNIDALNQRGLGTYALQAHFDFVLIDENHEAVVAIEFDGSGHDSVNDIKKDSICFQAGLPLIRLYAFDQVREINEITIVRYLVELVFHARAFLRMKEKGVIASDEPFILSSFLKEDANHIFDSEFDFVAGANDKITRALQKGGLASDPLPHLSISRIVLRAPDGLIRAFVSINSSKGPIIGTSILKIALSSLGFLERVETIEAEIAEFANGMATAALLENINFIVDGFGHVVTTAEEVLAELRVLGPMGYKLVVGNSASCTDTDLMRVFAEGNSGELF